MMTPPDDPLRAALDALARAAAYEAGDCPECGAPPEDGHSEDCPREPLNGIHEARDYLAALQQPARSEGPRCDFDCDACAVLRRTE